MNKEKLLQALEMAGEVLVIIGAALWLPMRTIASASFAAGTLLFAVGRFLQTPLYTKYARTDKRELTLRRLYHQRVFGMVALVLSAALMHTPSGFYYGIWVGKSSWLVMFVFFVITEVYTIFRISAVDKQT